MKSQQDDAEAVVDPIWSSDRTTSLTHSSSATVVFAKNTKDQNAARRALLGRWAIPLLGLVAALAVTARTHFFFILPYVTPVSNDEGYLAAMALRMMRGHWLPYVDGVSQRGPILYWLVTAWMRLGPQWSWLPMRLLGLCLAWTTVSLVFVLAAQLFSPMAGGVAALVATYFLTYELAPWDGVGVNGEPLAVAFALGAALLIARVQMNDPPLRRRLLFWTGVLTACAGLSKQMFLLHGLPVGLWILLGPVDRQAPWSERRREAFIFSFGLVVPYALVVGLYAATGHLRTFVYYYQRYGREIFMDPLTPGYVRDKLREEIDRYFLGIAALGIAWFFAISRALRQTLAAPSEGTGQTVPEASRESLRYAPETYAVLNVPVPGLGLGLLPGRRYAGISVSLVAVAILVLRIVLRRVWGMPYGASAIAGDVSLWFLLGVATAVLTGWFIRNDHPAALWKGLDRLRSRAVPWYAIAQMTCAFAGACFTFRFFPHYFVEFFPFAAVLVGGMVTTSFSSLDGKDRPGLSAAFTLILGLTTLLVVANSALQRNVGLRRDTDRWYQDPATDPIARYVYEHTTPDQTIFVWGFRAETYLSSRRYPGSRFVYTVYPAGVVPWFPATHEEEERRSVPGSREQVLQDLEKEQPELVVDAGRSMNGRYMYNYPVLRAYLDRRYCFMRYVDGEPVYRRRHGERCPPTDY